MKNYKIKKTMGRRRVLWEKNETCSALPSPFGNEQKPKHPWVGRRFRVRKNGKVFRVRRIAITPFGHLIIDPDDRKKAYDLSNGTFVNY